MSILFAISTAAFLALLWASFSIAHHIRASDHLSSPNPRPARFYRPLQTDLNDPPLSRRMRQSPLRTAPNADRRSA